jgi:hypothetical protein
VVNLTTTDRDTRFAPKASTDLSIRKAFRAARKRTPPGTAPGVPPSTRPSTREVVNNSPVTGMGGLLSSFGGAAKDLVSGIAGTGVARGIGGALSALDKPISERLGISIPDLPGPFDEVGNFILEEASRPTSLVFAIPFVGQAAGAAAITTRIGIGGASRAVPGILRPIVTRGGFAGQAAGEIAVSAGARGLAEIAAEQTNIPGGPIIGGLVGGFGTAILLSRGKFQSVPEMQRRIIEAQRRSAKRAKKILDQQIRVSSVLLTGVMPEPAGFRFRSASEEVTFGAQQVTEFEDAYRIINAHPGSEITDGRLVPMSEADGYVYTKGIPRIRIRGEIPTFGDLRSAEVDAPGGRLHPIQERLEGKILAPRLVEEARADTAVKYDDIAQRASRSGDESEALRILDSWIKANDTRSIRRIARGLEPEEGALGREATVRTMRTLYNMGESFRTMVAPFVDSDGTITIFRGEKNYTPGTFGEGRFQESVFRSPQAVQSYSVLPLGAAWFAAKSGTDKTLAWVIMRRVPLEDVLINPVSITETELLVIDRNLMPNDVYYQITGKHKTEIGMLEGTELPRPMEREDIEAGLEKALSYKSANQSRFATLEQLENQISALQAQKDELVKTPNPPVYVSIAIENLESEISKYSKIYWDLGGQQTTFNEAQFLEAADIVYVRNLINDLEKDKDIFFAKLDDAGLDPDDLTDTDLAFIEHINDAIEIYEKTIETGVAPVTLANKLEAQKQISQAGDVIPPQQTQDMLTAGAKEELVTLEEALESVEVAAGLSKVTDDPATQVAHAGKLSLAEHLRSSIKKVKAYLKKALEPAIYYIDPDTGKKIPYIKGRGFSEALERFNRDESGQATVGGALGFPKGKPSAELIEAAKTLDFVREELAEVQRAFDEFKVRLRDEQGLDIDDLLSRQGTRNPRERATGLVTSDKVLKRTELGRQFLAAQEHLKALLGEENFHTRQLEALTGGRSMDQSLEEFTGQSMVIEPGTERSFGDMVRDLLNDESGSIAIESALGKRIIDGARRLFGQTLDGQKNGIIIVPNNSSPARGILDAQSSPTALVDKITPPTTKPVARIQVTETADTTTGALDEALEAYKEAQRAVGGGEGTRPPDAPSGGGGRGDEPPQNWNRAALEAAVSGGDIFTQVNNMLRTLWATLDGSWFGIQGLLSLVDNPALTARSMRQALKAVTDPSVLDDYLKAIDEEFAAKGVLYNGEPLTIAVLEKEGLQIAHNRGTEISIAEDTLLGKIPGIKESNRLFSASGDFVRINLMMSFLETHGTKDLRKMIGAINRSTGVSSGKLFGQPGNVLFFAPRFFQSQLEIIMKAAFDWGPNAFEGNMARRQLLKLVGTGVVLTVAVNEFNGEDTVFDPRDSNFMKMRNIKGVDISVFGPWDSLVRGITKTAQGDLGYFPRTKASPIISTAIDLARGTTFLGENAHDPKIMAKSLLLPFAWQDALTEPIAASALGFFGVKSTPLTGNEVLENNMKRDGLDPADPLERRQYLLEHPEDIPKSTREDQVDAELVRNKTEERRALLEEQVLTDQMTLAEFREARKLISRDQRSKLNVILGSFDRKPRNAQQVWITTYFDLFDEAKDPITEELNGETLDRLQARWLNTYGQVALRYVNEFSLVGRGEVDSAYLKALADLEAAGYFNMKKFRGMKSDLTEDQISDYRLKVQAARFADDRLNNVPFQLAVRIVLKELNLSSKEIRDVINAGSGVFKNPQYTKFLVENKELVAWFNPAARWSTLQAVTGR